MYFSGKSESHSHTTKKSLEGYTFENRETWRMEVKLQSLYEAASTEKETFIWRRKKHIHKKQTKCHWRTIEYITYYQRNSACILGENTMETSLYKLRRYKYYGHLNRYLLTNVKINCSDNFLKTQLKFEFKSSITGIIIRFPNRI